MVSQKDDHCFVVSFMIYPLKELLMARIHGNVLADPLVASIALQISKALTYMHGRDPRVIHHGIHVKPSNIMVTVRQ